MNIDLSKNLLDLRGSVIVNENNKPVTLGDIITNACIAQIPDDKKSVSDKTKLFAIAVKCSQGGIVKISVEDATIIKNRVGELYGPLIVGRVFEIIDGKTKD